MPRQSKQEIDDEIVEHAAALFAQHGFRETSVQRIADAAGYSKTGLLHRFPSKEALWEAALGSCSTAIEQVATPAALPDGPDRDRAMLAQLADLALARPGSVTLALAVLTRPADPDEHARLEDIIQPLMRAFGVAPDHTDPDRVVRVITALGGLALTAVALNGPHPLDQVRNRPIDEIREYLVAASYGALGHSR